MPEQLTLFTQPPPVAGHTPDTAARVLRRYGYAVDLRRHHDGKYAVTPPGAPEAQWWTGQDMCVFAAYLERSG